MRYSWLALVGVLVCATVGSAQPPSRQPAPPAEPARDNKLDGYLREWEKAMQSVQSLAAQLERTDVNKTFGSKDIYVGTAQFLKPNLALLAMAKKEKPDVLVEKFVCSGTNLYQYFPQQKEIRVHPLPQPKQGQVADDNILSFLFGMKADEAKRRYDMKLAKEDQWYIYVEILPRFDADKADFHRARLVLLKDNFLPRQLWFEQANGDEVIWDIPRVENGAKLNRKDFESPAVPTGWKMVQAPKGTDVPPRVVRPQN